MNNLILKEIYRAVLFSKLSENKPCDIDHNDITFSDIQKIMANNNMHFIENVDSKCYMFKYNNTIFISIHSVAYYEKKLTKFKDKICINSTAFLQYQALEDKLIQNIHEYDKNKNIKKLYICGYKLGGSVATVVASILAEKFRHTYLVSCFTFGAFKVGNKYFKEYFNRHVTCNYRIMVEGDTHWSNHWKHYTHVSDYLQLENDNITEKSDINCTRMSALSNLFCAPMNIVDSAVTVNTYIEKLNSIITAYNLNIKGTSKPIICIPCFKKDENDSTSSSLSSKSISAPNTKTHSPISDDLTYMILKKIEHMDTVISRMIEKENRNMQIKDIVLQL
jgi:hypothetical protein